MGEALLVCAKHCNEEKAELTGRPEKGINAKRRSTGKPDLEHAALSRAGASEGKFDRRGKVLKH
ncbi:MAG: hypothetical protein WBM14_16980 [Terracidiphilus sp.]|jgi:hypothetical protein